jgi:hypothetical protein
MVIQGSSVSVCLVADSNGDLAWTYTTTERDTAGGVSEESAGGLNVSVSATKQWSPTAQSVDDLSGPFKYGSVGYDIATGGLAYGTAGCDQHPVVVVDGGVSVGLPLSASGGTSYTTVHRLDTPGWTKPIVRVLVFLGLV